MGLLDTIVGGVSVVGAVSGGTVVLTPSNLANGTITVTGALSADSAIAFPAVQGWWSIENLTTGSFSLFVQSGANTQVICAPPGEITDIQVNVNNVKFRNLARIGSYMDLSTSSVPSWITKCTVPPYLLCDGSSFSAGTYPYLNTILGGTTLPDLRGRSRFYLNGGTNRITSAISGINGDSILSAGGNQSLQSHSHANTVNDPGHTHSHNANQEPSGGTLTGGSGFGVGVVPLQGFATINPQTTGISLSNAAAGAGGSQNMPPAAIGGITLVRAG